MEPHEGGVGIPIHQAQTLQELQQMIDERFEYYNRRRRHSSIGL